MSTDEERRADPLALEDRLTIATPEGVEVELTLAGVGSRFIAGTADVAIQGLVLVALALILRSAGGAGVAVLISASFALIFFYHVLFEVLAGGRTPGKRLTGLRVVRSGGRPVGLTASALRNVLRLIDFVPTLYALGVTVMFVSSRNQRLGDLAAGTFVVRDRHGDRGEPLHAPLPAVDPGPAAAWDVSAVSADDAATVRAFLERRDDLQAGPRAELAAELAGRLRPRVGGAREGMADEPFLELLLAAKAARSG